MVVHPLRKRLGASWCKAMFWTPPDSSTSGLPITCCKAFFSDILVLAFHILLCFILFLLLVYQSYSECHVTFYWSAILMNAGWCDQKVKGIPGQCLPTQPPTPNKRADRSIVWVISGSSRGCSLNSEVSLLKLQQWRLTIAVMGSVSLKYVVL